MQKHGQSREIFVGSLKGLQHCVFELGKIYRVREVWRGLCMVGIGGLALVLETCMESPFSGGTSIACIHGTT
jgi:hypothetical protein